MTAAAALSAEDVRVASRLALAHARTADGLLVVEPGRELVFAPGGAGAAGAVRSGRTALIPGGPLAAPADVPALLDAVDRWCGALGVAPLWLNVTEPELPPLAAAGYGPTKVAEHCLVPHPGRWSGGRYRGVRAGCHRARRRGVTVGEFAPCGLSPVRRASFRGDLARVRRRHLAAKPQRRAAAGFVAPVPDVRCGPRRLWAAAAGGQTVAFATAHPLAPGNDGERRWTLGGFHVDPAAPPGTTTLLIRTLLDDLAAGGVSVVSLGPAPALRCENADPGGAPLVRRGVAFWFRRLNGLFDARGLWQFKSRFRPELEPLYACGRPRVGVRAAADFVRASGVLHASPAAVWRGTVNDWRRPARFGRVPP